LALSTGIWIKETIPKNHSLKTLLPFSIKVFHFPPYCSLAMVSRQLFSSPPVPAHQ
jgi:hypothetical protein